MKSFCLHAIERGTVYIQYALPNTCSLAKLNEVVSRNLSEFEDACIDGKRSFRALRGWWLKQWITRLFHGGSMVKNLPSVQETWIRSLDWEDPMEKGMKTHPGFLAWRIPWTRSLAGYSTWCCKESAQLSDWAHRLSPSLPQQYIERDRQTDT